MTCHQQTSQNMDNSINSINKLFTDTFQFYLQLLTVQYQSLHRNTQKYLCTKKEELQNTNNIKLFSPMFGMPVPCLLQQKNLLERRCKAGIPENDDIWTSSKQSLVQVHQAYQRAHIEQNKKILLIFFWGIYIYIYNNADKH